MSANDVFLMWRYSTAFAELRCLWAARSAMELYRHIGVHQAKESLFTSRSLRRRFHPRIQTYLDQIQASSNGNSRHRWSRLNQTRNALHLACNVYDAYASAHTSKVAKIIPYLFSCASIAGSPYNEAEGKILGGSTPNERPKRELAALTPL